LNLQSNLKLLGTTTALAVILGLCNLGLAGCETSQPGVESNKVQQWTTVNGDIEAATEAAEDVLEEYDLRDIEAMSTSLDGEVKGKKADDTDIWVNIKKLTDETSEVTVQVGKVGDTALGAEIASKIKKQLAE
jgi:hypothetical protein